MSFKSLLTDPSNRLSSWKGDNCCNWKGIKCSSSGHVVVVNLQNPHPDEVIINANKEVVNLSPLLFTIDHIQYLDLSFNNFVFSKLPAEISNLTNLAYLNLSNSMFQDSITTQFSNLTSLRSLDVSCANLLPDLSSITVSLTLTPKLDSSSLLSFINYGYLSSQNLRWLEGLQCLRYLVLTVPWSKLTSLDISFTREGGTVPPSLSNSTSITVFLDDGCSIEGSIPPSITKLKKLRLLMLNDNDITGQHPNRLQGNIPISICQILSPEYLNLNWNDLTGRLPSCILQLPKLSYFYVQKNNLNVDTPLSLFRKSRLDQISFGVSGLSVEIDNQDQYFQTGTVQKELERVTSLRYLDLNGNEFEGSFPTAIEKFQDLEMLNLAGNIFEGRIPKFIVYSYNTRFDVSPSALTGKIPEKIGLLNGIPFLNLSHNNLFGLIPKSIGNMISLESLDLSCNNFTGEIPVTLTQLDFLAYLNLSYNNLSGRIPTNPHFDTLYQDGTAYIGNKYLCGAPDGMNRSDNNRPSTNETTENRYDQENILFVLVILSGFVTGISSVFLLLYLIADNWRNRYWRSVDKILLKIVN
ncbi:MDIS1-interacting receptor like kinase 2-like [Capsicum annuum]|uniref:MDIS1-interacting receptor like kinase 2-like n=1 Tax=Capsicum annuum TaxID=4072 RepID=UPI001FB1280A|nr:MDIS1-interacting receptor like kinase 2-like [Capsicum annuum]